MNQDKNVNSINVTVNKLYELNEIKTLVEKLTPQTKQTQIRGIAFYPFVSGTKLLFMFNKSVQVNKQEGYVQHQKFKTGGYIPKQIQIKQGNVAPVCKHSHTSNSPLDEHYVVKPKQKCHYVCKSNDQVILTFEMKRTDQCDNYTLYLVNKCVEGTRTILKTKKIGIAYIPTIQCSRMCNEITLANNGKVLMKCKYDETKEKWIPIEQDKEKKIPDYITTLDEKMDIIYDDE